MYHDQRTTRITHQLPPPPQLASTQKQALNFNKLQSLDQYAEKRVRDGQNQRAEHQEVPRRRWRGLSLRTKATAMALAIGTLPVLIVGATAYYFTNQSITEQIIQNQQRAAINLEDKLEIFMHNRYSDIQAMAALDIFTNSQMRSIKTRQEKDAQLNLYIKAYGGIYNSIAVFDLNGNVLAQSKGDALSKHRDRDYFQAVLKTNRTLISEPQQESISPVIFSIHTATPIKDTVTGKTVAIIRARMPVDSFKMIFDSRKSDADAKQTQEFYLVDTAGKIFGGSGEGIGG